MRLPLGKAPPMSVLNALIAPVAGLLDKIIPDPKAREAAKLELLKLDNS